jgi:hypothetical protein
MAQPRKYDGELDSGWGFGSSGELIAGNESKRVTMQFPLKHAGEATVQLGCQTRDNEFASVRFAAIAEIFWSVGGNTVRRVVSLKDGMSITGVGEHVKVIITDDSRSDDTIPPGIEWAASMTVAPGSRSATQQPPYLEEQVPYEVAAGATVDVPIPQNSGVISVYVMAAAAVGVALADNSILVQQRFLTVPTKQYDPRNYGWVPITPYADSLRLSVAGAVGGPVRFAVVWGIDG